MKTKSLLVFFFPLLLLTAAYPQTAAGQKEVVGVERELRQFYDSYAEDLRQHRPEGIAKRYDTRGYFSLGNGSKRFVTFDDNKKRYLTEWSGPKNFDWKDLSFEVLSPTSAAVAGLFDWTRTTGEKDTLSYTAVLTKQSGEWRIRIEDESANTAGYSTKAISGGPMTPGPYKFSLAGQPGVCLSAHRHTTDRRITIKSGRLFILMGDLESARVQRFDAGSTFVLPANTWHVEWWEDDINAEVETTAPARTERPTAAAPRVP
jgi:hypothetical protein